MPRASFIFQVVNCFNNLILGCTSKNTLFFGRIQQVLSVTLISGNTTLNVSYKTLSNICKYTLNAFAISVGFVNSLSSWKNIYGKSVPCLFLVNVSLIVLHVFFMSLLYALKILL